MKKFKDGGLQFATNEHFGKIYVYNMNGMCAKQIGIYDDKESVLLDFPTAEFETIENAKTCTN